MIKYLTIGHTRKTKKYNTPTQNSYM